VRRAELTAISALAILLGTSAAQAQDTQGDDPDGLEITMTLLPEQATTPDVVTNDIELPDSEADEGGAHSADGLAAANEARSQQDDGLETAEDAVERGREFAEDMAAQAQENRENAERGDAPDLSDVPDSLNVPDSLDVPGDTTPPTPPAGP
jgi:hypothetical protein